VPVSRNKFAYIFPQFTHFAFNNHPRAIMEIFDYTASSRQDIESLVRKEYKQKGVILTVERSNKNRVTLKCHRGGAYKNVNSKLIRKSSTRLIECPFKILISARKNVWKVRDMVQDHNHVLDEKVVRQTVARRIPDDPTCKHYLKQCLNSGKPVTIQDVHTEPHLSNEIGTVEPAPIAESEPLTPRKRLLKDIEHALYEDSSSHPMLLERLRNVLEDANAPMDESEKAQKRKGRPKNSHQSTMRDKSQFEVTIKKCATCKKAGHNSRTCGQSQQSE
jgi:flagellar biosynthesis GTPase FlhF